MGLYALINIVLLLKVWHENFIAHYMVAKKKNKNRSKVIRRRRKVCVSPPSTCYSYKILNININILSTFKILFSLINLNLVVTLTLRIDL